MALRTPDGGRALRSGGAVPVPRGPAGAHQVVNRAGGPARVLMASAMVEPELSERPDTGAIGMFADRPPGRERDATPDRTPRGDARVGHHEGEPTG